MVERKTDNLEAIGSSPIVPSSTSGENDRIWLCSLIAIVKYKAITAAD